MKWNKEKMNENYGKIPMDLFSKTDICPICNTKVNPANEKFEATGMNPYTRCFDKFYWVHKECFFVKYIGMKRVIDENKDEFMVEDL